MHDNQTKQLYEALAEIPILDAHTHLVGGKLGARGLHDILLYHMAVSDLYAAGCPTGERLTQYPNWPTTEEAHSRVREALPFLHHVQNTSTSWGIRMILRDLYGWDQPIREDSWKRLDAMIRERADDRVWHREILTRANIRRSVTEFARREDDCDADILQYSLEWAFFTRCQWGEYDTALYELERCWGKTPENPTPIGMGPRPKTERTIHSLEDVHVAVESYVRSIPYDKILSTATHISTDLDLEPVTDAQMRDALNNRHNPTHRERNIYASYINELYLSALEEYADRIVFQFSLGAEPLPHETVSRLSSTTIRQIGEMIAHHPRLRFQCFLAGGFANQSLCTLCRELPNFSLAGYWWHNFFPSTIAQIMRERLDMLPSNRQIGFFSDAYCVEWAYAKTRIVRTLLAEVLAEKIQIGQYSIEDAKAIAYRILFEAPQALLGMVP
ncbi:MAG TPA: hypothetical protein PLY86_00960 [bacterium]|nr:hypothetical protein [bacterium]